MIDLPLGNISLFNTSHSIDILPGPVNNRLIPIAISNNSSSYPSTKPFDILTRRVAPIISIIKSAAAILVTTPTSRNIPQLLRIQKVVNISRVIDAGGIIQVEK
jgi:hypothetical protein